VRDGAGESPPGGYSYKGDLKFPPPQSDGQTCQTLTFPSHVGVMFKVYVSYTEPPGASYPRFEDSIEFRNVKKTLEESGYIEVSCDGRPTVKNAWFIIRDFVKIVHSSRDGTTIVDNFYLD